MESDGLVATYRTLLLEGDLDGNPTGRRIPLPLPTAPPPYEHGSPAGITYDPTEHRYYYVEALFDGVWAVDTLGNTVTGYPVSGPLGNLGPGPDAHGGEAGGPEGVRLEVLVSLQLQGFRCIVVTNRRGESLRIVTEVPDLSDGTAEWRVRGNPLRSRFDPNGVMYIAFDNDSTAGVVGFRPHPLPPSWLAVSVWRGTLSPGESAEVVLTFSAGLRAVGDYTAALQVIEAASGVVVEVPLALSVTQGTAVEPGPETEGVRLSVYPNPARGRAEVVLTLAEAAEMSVSVYDMLGRRVELLHAGLLGAGEHKLPLDVAGLPAGVYVVRVVRDGGSQVRARRLIVRR